MPGRKPLPDVMADVLGTSTPAGQPDSTPAQQPTISPAGRRTGKTVKATFYLTSGVVDALEAAWLQARMSGAKVTKSALVEEALRTQLGLAE